MINAWWQRALLAIVIFTSVGTLGELLLLEHTEEPYQWIPIVLLGITAASATIVLLLPHRRVVLAFRGLMVLCLISAGVGIYLHYLGNTEFELERRPNLRGWPLFKRAMMGATPALAPGTMAQLALIGLLATFSRSRSGAARDRDVRL